MAARKLGAEAIDWVVFLAGCAACVGVAFLLDAPPWGLALAGIVVGPVTLTAAEIIGIAVRGQTVGKRCMGLRVLRSGTLEAPGWRRAATRTLSLIPWSSIVGRGSTATFRYAHGLHDDLAGTMVVDDRAGGPRPLRATYDVTENLCD